MIEPALAGRIRLAAFDVDGVLTDGSLFIASVAGERVELKRFSSLDGMAVWLLHAAGIRTALVSGRSAEATRLRAAELGIEDVIQDGSGQGNKLAPFEALAARRGVKLEECAYVGDDIPDLPLMRRVRLPVAVANAVPEVKAAAAYVTRARGGHGAVREFAETLLRARGVWDEVVGKYLRDRGDESG